MTSRIRTPSGGRPPTSGARRVTAYERLKQAMLSGELAPGQQLVESQLAEWCEVSRTPIREALTRLEQDGLVKRTDRGLIVYESSPDEILDIYEVRIVLEATAARTAAERRTTNDLMLMRIAAERMTSTEPADHRRMAASNVEFHRSVWRAGHNDTLTDLLERLNMHLGRYPETTLAYSGRWNAALEEHQNILAAVERRDADLAADLATRHFGTARDIRLKLWASEQVSAPAS